MATRDLPALARLINEDLLGNGDVPNVRSSLVQERIKRTIELPLGQTLRPLRSAGLALLT